ncbi:MAG TPA: hypothetical protein VGM37_10430 [Armatimonadota bacterium]|jgi:hypothetical protein
MTSQWTAYPTAPVAGISPYSQLDLFRMMYQPVSAGLLAGGWQRAAGIPGQLDWSTVTVPAGGANTHFEIFRPGDDLFAAFPFTVKLTYRISATYGMQLAIQLARSFDAAANPVGAFLGSATNTGSVTGTAPYVSCLFADSGGFALSLLEGSSVGLFICLDRSRGNTGDPTDEYVTLVVCSSVNNGMTGQSTMTKDGTLSPPVGAFVSAAPPYNISGGMGGSVPVSPVFPWVGKLGNPMLNACVGQTADFTGGTPVTVSAYGKPAAYRAVGNTFPTGSVSSVRLLMRWE